MASDGAGSPGFDQLALCIVIRRRSLPSSWRSILEICTTISLFAERFTIFQQLRKGRRVRAPRSHVNNDAPWPSRNLCRFAIRSLQYQDSCLLQFGDRRNASSRSLPSAGPRAWLSFWNVGSIEWQSSLRSHTAVLESAKWTSVPVKSRRTTSMTANDIVLFFGASENLPGSAFEKVTQAI